MSRTNRRFPFERTKDEIVLPTHLKSSSDQLYPILRDYLSVSRSSSSSSNEKQVVTPRTIVSTSSSSDRSRLNDFMADLKRSRPSTEIDPNDFTQLREDSLRHWKSIREKWQNYYREENKQEEIRFSHMSSIVG